MAEWVGLKMKNDGNDLTLLQLRVMLPPWRIFWVERED